MKLRYRYTVATATAAFFISVAINATLRTTFRKNQSDFTESICSAVGNYLETGSLRPAFEVLTLATEKSFPGSCVTLIDQGRSFAPPCLRRDTSYYPTACYAEANSGVRAEVLYPVQPFFSLTFALMFTSTFSILLLLVLITSRFGNLIASQVEATIADQFGKKQAHTASVGRQLLDLIGASSSVQSNAEALVAQLRREQILRTAESRSNEHAKRYVSKALQVRHDMAAPLAALMSLRTKQANIQATEMLSEVINRLKGMMNDLSETSIRKSELHSEVLEMLIEDVITTQLPALQASGAALNMVSNGYATIAQVDGDKFKRVVSNLVTNSLEACASQITIELCAVENMCSVILTDNGRGVAPEIRAKLFEKGASFGKLNGNGLGLFSAREILREWNGDLKLHNSKAGATFELQIPIEA